MRKDTLNKLHDSADAIRHVSDDLSALAGAFHATGNKIVANQLYSMSDALVVAYNAVNEGAGEAIHDACRASEEATANLMTGVFLMATRNEAKP